MKKESIFLRRKLLSVAVICFITATASENLYAESLFPHSNSIISSVYFQENPVTGVVSDSSGNPVAGATVTVKETGATTTTDAEGKFSIQASKGQTLLVKSSEFADETIIVEDDSVINFTLKSNDVRENKIETVTVIGSRGKPRTDVERPVPIDVFSAKDIQKTGQTELGQMIHFSAPSFNSVKFGISNVSSYVDPATLRGLGPDQTLVLVNGKRRHQSAALNVNNVVGRGTVGTDLNIIPTAAIERVEILRDGAAAQYGSDAIAGVINVQLKRNSKGGSYSAHVGLTKEGDGKTYEQSINFGLPLGKKGGFLNTTLQMHHNDPTDRSEPFTGRVYNSNEAIDNQMIAEHNFNRQIKGTKYGIAKNTNGTLFLNSEIPLGDDWALYGNGGYTYKAITAYGFFRPPVNSKRAVLGIYPNGYSPVFPANLYDGSVTAGIKKTNKEGWSLDFSNTYGKNKINLFSNNTVNPSFGIASPTSFYGGTLSFWQNSINVDVDKTFDDLSFAKSINLAMGAEYRTDGYQILQGDYASWAKGSLQNTDVGANGREGFNPGNEVNKTRNNVGVYVDTETDFSDKFLVGLAGRFENYSGFGSNLSGKLSTRYKVIEEFSLRGSINRGFRAPSLHQLYYSSDVDAQWLTINNVFDAYPIAHLRNDNPTINNLVGNLKAETSWDFNLGATLQLFNKKFLMTVDAYQIDIKNRIVISSQLRGSVLGLSQYPLVQFFSNAIDTRTKGVDIVANYNEKFNDNNALTLSAAFMYNETKQKGETRVPAGFTGDKSTFIDRNMIGLIEVAQPRQKLILSANYKFKMFEAMIRATKFGSVTARQNTEIQDQTFAGKTIADASLTWNVNSKISWSFGANNVFNTYPDRIDLPALTSVGQTPYTRFTNQFGFMGSYYYTSVKVNF
ncbi:TonB-dependent receptor [Chryseobacterium sp. GP-SGM7]|uniref:TonB-dependent receptor n=1 Tax=Chryseobacterium sp. GP-SGM7 TaxID=3411323 RepID=UPI003B943D75